MIKQLAQDHVHDFPNASSVALNDFYVDDCLSGVEDLEQAVSLQQQLVQLFHCGKMCLRKWRTNNPHVLEAIPEALRETDTSPLTIHEPSDCGRALGIRLDTAKDVFYVVTPDIPSGAPTKILIASTLARLYDYMGWVSPVSL